MKFRPDDPFCHSLYASKQPATSILLRVKKRYKKRADKIDSDSDCQEDGLEELQEAVMEEAEYQTELVGIIDSAYHFKGEV